MPVSYTTIGAHPTSLARGAAYSRRLDTNAQRESAHMTGQYVFADVNLPFHVWMKEGNRWVLRDRGEPPRVEASYPSAEPHSASVLPTRPRRRPRA